MKTDIIVPTFGQEEHTIKCFESLLKETEDFRLIWVDNGSSVESRQKVMPYFNQIPNRLPIWLSYNTGFIKAVNVGLEASMNIKDDQAEFIVLQNNDTIVTTDWLDRMLKVLEENPKISAAGPTTTAEGSWQGYQNAFKKIPIKLGFELGGQQEDIIKVIVDKYQDSYFVVNMIAFFCTVFKRQIFEEVGLLDEIFGSGLADDDDFCFRIKKAGYQVAFVPSSYVVHNHRTTFRSIYKQHEINNMTKQNIKLYKQKHGIKP